MSMNRHEPFEELISASLHGDLTADEQARLDAHLDTCAQCRATLAAFSEQRRIMAGLRHVAPPSDLGARVRTGIASGAAADLPWWRRRPFVVAGIGGGLAVVAGALLAIVLLDNEPTSPPVGQATPSASAEPSFVPPTPTPAPTSTAPTQAPSVAATPAETPIPSPEPDVFLALTGSVEDPELEVLDDAGEPLAKADPPSGEPIAAELSPDGQWLAYISVVGESGMNEIRVTRIAGDGESPVGVGSTVSLGQSTAGSPFLEHLFWAPDGSAMAFTRADPDDGSINAWIFDPVTGQADAVTDSGDAYAGSFTMDASAQPLLWISRAGETPTSYLISPDDPSQSSFPDAHDVFQPIVSPNGARVIFWSGQMRAADDGWVFSRGGLPWLAENTADADGGFSFESARELFGDLTPVSGEAFESAAVDWGGDSDAYAVWAAAWTGTSQASDGIYPDPARIYFGHATDARGLTQDQAIDAGDIPAGQFVVDVKVSPTGHHLVVTAGHPRAGVLDPPRADLLLVTRNLGNVPDEVENLVPDGDGWFGPAAFDEAP
jgi:hypothetical protein